MWYTNRLGTALYYETYYYTDYAKVITNVQTIMNHCLKRKEKKQQSLSYLIHNTKKEENERQYKKCDYDEQVYSLEHNKKI